MVHSRPASDRDMGYDDLKTKVSTLEIKLQQFGKILFSVIFEIKMHFRYRMVFLMSMTYIYQRTKE